MDPRLLDGWLLAGSVASMASYNSRCHTHKSLKSNLVQWPAAAISTFRFATQSVNHYSYRIVSHLFIMQMERGITVQRTLPNRVLNKWWWYARDIWSKFQATTGGLGTFLNNICFMSLSMGYWFSIGKWVLDFFFSFFFFFSISCSLNHGKK